VALLDNQGKPPSVFSSPQTSRAAVHHAVVAYWAAYAKGGDQGARGPVGAAGAQGSRGASGIQGLVGLEGARGPQGLDGDPGTDNQTQGPPGAPGIFAAAHIVTSTCSPDDSYDYVGDTYFYCIAACPLGEASLAGWRRFEEEGSYASVANPILVPENAEYAEDLGLVDHEAVVEEVFDNSFESVRVSVAIACLPGIPSPLAPPS
jgi:hypothetical protein